ncbi:hypothetical protein [Kitasatospora sp. LaBMicrA B282]|uniref:hypothetical protein n=1 Tax=Kitasatospora sp. LaBMicrA B282 TaxID=3420949 RepID=UPI003D0EE522
MTRAVLLLGATGSTVEQLVRAAQGLDVAVHLATDRAAPQAGPAGAVRTDFRSAKALDRLAAYCARTGIEAVAAGRADLARPAAELARRLGLPGHDPDAVGAGHDRWRTALALQRHGVPVPRTLGAADGAQALARLHAAGWTYPVLVSSPVSSTGEAVLVAEPAQLARLRRPIRGRPLAPPPGGGRPAPALLVQEYLAGPEFGIDTVLHRGLCRHLPVVRIRCTPGPQRRTTGFTVPAGLDLHATAAVFAAVEAAVAALGLRDGVAHTSVRVTAHGVQVLGIVPVPAAQPTMQLLEQATGMSTARAHLLAALGDWPDLRPDRDRAAALRFISTDRSGVFRGFDGLAAGPHLAVVRSYREPGDRVGDAGAGSTRLGHLIVLAEDAARAEAWADQAVAGITSRVEPFGRTT